MLCSLDHFICVCLSYNCCSMCISLTHALNVKSRWDMSLLSWEKTRKCRVLVNLPLIPVKCRLDVSWNLHQCLVIVISASAWHYGDSFSLEWQLSQFVGASEKREMPWIHMQLIINSVLYSPLKVIMQN